MSRAPAPTTEQVKEEERSETPAFDPALALLPFLSPITDVLAKNPLQPYQTTLTSLSTQFRALVINLIRKASQVGDGSPNCSALRLELNPLDVRDAEVHLLRAPNHRPTPSGFRTAFSVAYLQILANLNNHNQQAAGFVTDPVPHLQAFFKPPNGLSATNHDRRLPEASRLLATCSHHLPNPAKMSLAEFDPRRAVVWMCVPGKTLDTVPQFFCIAGWARWSALLAVLEGIRYKCSPQNIPETYKRALETTVPVYIIDGSELSAVDVMALSMGLNAADCARKRGTTAEVLSNFVSATALTEIRSRPTSLADRLWLMHHVLVQTVLETQKIDTHTPLVQQVRNFIKATLQLQPIQAWLEEEAASLRRSPWVNNPLVFPNGVPESDDHIVDVLIAFLLYLGWPLEHDQVMHMTLRDFRNLSGPAFPFCDFDSRGNKSGGVGFMDELLLHHIPYQVQTVFTLGDMFALVRVFETFFLPRNKRLNRRIALVNWRTTDHVSLINHFCKEETASAFVARIVTHEPLKSMSAHAQPWCFESLSAFICMYNLHFILELLETPITTPCSTMDPATSVPEDISGVRPPGTARTLHLLRAMIMTAYLTYDNPAQLLDLAKSQIGEAALATPLEIPSVCSPNVSVMTTVLFNAETGDTETRRQLEESFELILGSLAELVFRELSAGLGRDECFPSPWSPSLPAEVTQLTAIKFMGLRSQSHEQPSIRSFMLLEALKGSALLVQLFLRQCHLASVGQPLTHAIALFGVPNTEATIKQRGDLNPATFIKVPIPDLLTARQRVYESIARSLIRAGKDANTLSHYNFVWRFMEPLEKKGLPKSAAVAEALLLNSFGPLQPPHTKSPQIKAPPPNRYPDGVVPSEPVDAASPNVTSFPAEDFHGSTKVEAQEAFNRACAQKLIALQQAHNSQAEKESKSSRSNATETQERIQELTRITHWFEDRKSEARLLIHHLRHIVQSPNTTRLMAFICADFRDMSPEEAKARCGPLSDLAAESTNLSASLQELPYQFQIQDASVLPFSAKALNSVCAEIEPVLQAHLREGLQQLINVKELGHSVVASARPAIICTLWQTLVQLSPFLDVLYPLALNWQRTRALFCSWLWSELRQKLQNFWHELCKEKLEGVIPALRWSLRCLPAEQDTHFLATLPDLTAERLQNVLRSPRTMDRICSAFYRFQCSGMANAKATLGGSTVIPTIKNLNDVFFTDESSLREVFIGLWASLPADAVVEDILHEPDIAAAGFLKRYAPFVLSGLELRDKQMELEEVTEPHAKRRRRDIARDSLNEDGYGRSRPRRKDDAHPSVVANATSIMALKRELRTMARHPIRRLGRPTFRGDGEMHYTDQGELLDDDQDDAQTKTRDNDDSSAANDLAAGDGWLRMLPLSLRLRLEQAIPSSEIYDALSTRLQTSRLSASPPAENSDQAPPTERLHSQRLFRKRRKAKSLAASDPNNKKISEEEDVAWNGAFPELPGWLESTPAWTLWQAIAKRPDSVAFTTKPPLADWQDYSQGSSMVQTLLQAEETPHISEPEWELVETVLECLARRGITALYSSSAKRMFTLDVHGANSLTTCKEVGKEIDDCCEHPSGWEEASLLGMEGRPTSKGISRRRGCLRNLRHFLNGMVIPERALMASPAGPLMVREVSESDEVPRIRNGPRLPEVEHLRNDNHFDLPEDVYLLLDSIH